ncbi:MAG: 7TM diverse intracellular signaling domain-containing protein [Oligoflexus sp.]
MNYFFSWATTIFLISSICHGQTPVDHGQITSEKTGLPTANQDYIDLRLFPFSQKIFEAQTPWDFYFGQLLTPENIHTGKRSAQLHFKLMQPESFEKDWPRYVTLHKRLLLPERTSQYSVFIPEIRSAAKVWLNGKLVLEAGVVGDSSEKEKSAMKPIIVDLHGDEPYLDIIVQMSGFASFEIGPSLPFAIGHPTLIHQSRQSPMTRDAFAVGAIAIMAFYHLSLFLLRRDRVAPLWFGMFCLLIVIRTLVRSEGLLIYQIIDQPNYQWHYRLEYWCFNLGSAICTHFVYVLYSRDLSRRLYQTVMICSIAYAVVVAVSPAYYFTQLLVPFQIFVLCCAMGIIYGLVRAIINRRSGALLFILGFLALMAGVTSDILKHNNIIQAPTMVHIGLFFFILFQAILLSKRFAKAFTRVEEAEIEIRQLNEGLERSVQERTQTIRIILDNVKAGFLLINQDRLIEGGFTKSCPEILGKEIREGDAFIDLFDLNKRQRDHLELAISQVFADMLPEAAGLNQIPSRLSIGERSISLQGSIVRDENGHVVSILFTITDATLLVHTEAEAKLNRGLLKILQDKNGFHDFVSDSFIDLGKAHKAVKQGDQTQARMILHTLKGNFFAFDLHEIAQQIHNEEDLTEISSQGLIDIEASIRQFLEEHKNLFANDTYQYDEKTYSLPNRAIQDLQKKTFQVQSLTELQSAVNEWLSDVQKVSALQLLGSLAVKTERLADHFGKSLDLHITGGDTLVQADKLRNVVQNMMHLVRNSIDHGIEFPEDRAPKNQRGRITISVNHKEDELLISLTDDGQGLDLENIKTLAIEQGLLSSTDAANISGDEVARLIFQPGFTTAKSVNALSGRGMGMTALLQAVEELGGHIDVHSETGKGTRFDLHIPETSSPQLSSKTA